MYRNKPVGTVRSNIETQVITNGGGTYDVLFFEVELNRDKMMESEWYDYLPVIIRDGHIETLTFKDYKEITYK